MPKKIEVVGLKSGRWTVLRRDESKSMYCICRCECGTVKSVSLSSIRQQKSKSCGCLQADNGPPNKRHGMTQTPTYKTWSHMLYRCLNESSASYPNYGGRGITVCKEWLSFDAFFADMGVKPAGTSIDRIDNNKGYSPTNCQWSDKRAQANNRRTSRLINWNGEERTLADLSRIAGISIGSFWSRLNSGWSIERIMTTATVVGRNQFTENHPAPPVVGG